MRKIIVLRILFLLVSLLFPAGLIFVGWIFAPQYGIWGAPHARNEQLFGLSMIFLGVLMMLIPLIGLVSNALFNKTSILTILLEVVVYVAWTIRGNATPEGTLAFVQILLLVAIYYMHRKVLKRFSYS